MNAQRLYSVARAAVAILTLAAVGVQFRGSVEDPFKSIVMFWSEFTYESNLAVAIALLLGAWLPWSRVQPGPWWQAVRGAMVAYTAMTFIVYRFLVEGTSNTPSTGVSYYESWASDVLHKVIPVVLLIDWLVMPPVKHLGYRQALIWPIYPLVFCGWSLMRGSIVDWYPYSFLDPDEAGSYGMVALFVVMITVGFLGISAIVVALGNLSSRRLEPAPAVAGAT
jgi:hypothetical protein